MISLRKSAFLLTFSLLVYGCGSAPRSHASPVLSGAAVSHAAVSPSTRSLAADAASPQPVVTIAGWQEERSAQQPADFAAEWQQDSPPSQQVIIAADREQEARQAEQAAILVDSQQEFPSPQQADLAADQQEIDPALMDVAGAVPPPALRLDSGDTMLTSSARVFGPFWTHSEKRTNR